MDLLEHWMEDELTLQHQRMRYRQAVRLHHMVSVKQNVKVDIPRALVDRLDPAQLLFNRLRSVQQYFGRERGLNLCRS